MEQIEQLASRQTAPIINITGDKIGLGPVRRDLIPLYQRWLNDFEVTSTLGTPVRPVTLEGEETWLEGVNKSERDILFTIYALNELDPAGRPRPIGNAGLKDINREHGAAEFGIVIGEKDCWGKGYGTETASLMLDYAFTALSLHNTMLRVFSNNERGIRAYTRAGFKVVGRLREAFKMGGRRYDVIYMDCLSTEFESPHLRKLLQGETA